MGENIFLIHQKDWQTNQMETVTRLPQKVTQDDLDKLHSAMHRALSAAYRAGAALKTLGHAEKRIADGLVKLGNPEHLEQFVAIRELSFLAILQGVQLGEWCPYSDKLAALMDEIPVKPNT